MSAEILHSTAILITIGIFVLMSLTIIVPLALQKRTVGGKPSTKKGVFFLGKLLVALPAITALFQYTGAELRQITIPDYAHWISIALLTISSFLFIGSFLNLGASTRIGLPKEETKLKTNGIYRISRNPMYLGVYCFNFAVCIYTANLWVLLISLLAMLLHHKIILGEEAFLRDRFGKDYENYSKQVRRYL